MIERSCVTISTSLHMRSYLLLEFHVGGEGVLASYKARQHALSWNLSYQGSSHMAGA